MRGGIESLKKRKLVIASIALTLSISVGTAFAVSDAGGQLQRWYDGRFSGATESINNDVVSPGLDRIESQLSDLKDRLIEDSKQAIKDMKSKTLLYSIGHIYSHMQGYIDSINSKKKELIGTDKKEGTISNDFDSFVKDKNKEVDKAADEAVQEFLNGLNEELNDKVYHSEKAIEQKASDAQSELSQDIAASKEQISNKLTVEEGIAQDEIKTHINSKLKESKNAVEENTNILVGNKVNAIKQEGLKIQGQAIQEMSNVISQI